MNSLFAFFSHNKMGWKSHAGHIAPARSVRLSRQGGYMLDETGRLAGLPTRIANAYVRFEDKARHAIRERAIV